MSLGGLAATSQAQIPQSRPQRRTYVTRVLMSARLCTVRRFLSTTAAGSRARRQRARTHSAQRSDRQQQRALKGGGGRLEYRCCDWLRRHRAAAEGFSFFHLALASTSAKNKKQKKHKRPPVFHDVSDCGPGRERENMSVNISPELKVMTLTSKCSTCLLKQNTAFFTVRDRICLICLTVSLLFCL